MKEELLVVAKASPVVSKKYEHLVCVAGITKNGEWRRIYPIPWSVFWHDSKGKFKKKQWIVYELKDATPSDHRMESRKIMHETIKILSEAQFSEIKAMLDSKITTIEQLLSEGHSLGVVKPVIGDFHKIDNKQYEKLVSMQKQKTLFGKSAVKIDIPKINFAYKFKCHEDCSGHDMLCEDWELGELYRKCQNMLKHGKYKDENEVIEKIKQRMLNDMLTKKELYFIVGTHNIWGTCMIVGIIYSKKSDFQ